MYRSVFPESQRESYQENANIDFLLNVGEGNALMPNSVRFSGKLQVKTSGAVITTQDVQYDAKSGIHGFVSSITTQGNQGVWENFHNYGRWVHMQNEAQETKVMNCCETGKNMELRMGTDAQTTYVMAGRVDGYAAGSGDETSTGVIDFSVKPDFCLNNMRGSMPFGKSGAIRVSIRLSPNSMCLFGTAPTLTYEITDLQCHFQAEQSSKGSIAEMVVKTSIKNVVSSANQQIQTRVPMVVDTVSTSFIKTTNLLVGTVNKFETERLPKVSSVEWAINDNNGYISFPLNDEGEVMLNYLLSLDSGNYNDMRISNPVGYGMGVKFPSPRDFTQNKLGLNIHSGVQNEANSYTAYMFFKGLISV